MARAIRSAVMLRLGVLSAPVDLIKATDTKESHKTVCISGHDPTKVRQTLACPQCGNDDRGSFVKASEVGDRLVVLTDDVLAGAAPSDEVKQTLTLTAHPAVDVLRQTMPSGSTYYLRPSKGAEDVYALLLGVLRSRPDVAFVVEFAARSAAELYTLSVHDGTITLSQLARPDTIRDAPNPPATADDATVEMMSALVDKLLQPFDPDTYRDRRAEYLAAAIEAAANGEQPTIAPVSKPDATSLHDQLAAALAVA